MLAVGNHLFDAQKYYGGGGKEADCWHRGKRFLGSSAGSQGGVQSCKSIMGPNLDGAPLGHWERHIILHVN